MLILKFLFLTLELMTSFKENIIIKIYLRVIIINMKWLSIQVPSKAKYKQDFRLITPKHDMAQYSGPSKAKYKQDFRLIFGYFQLYQGCCYPCRNECLIFYLIPHL